MTLKAEVMLVPPLKMVVRSSGTLWKANILVEGSLHRMLATVTSFVTHRLSSTKLRSVSPLSTPTEAWSSVGGTSQQSGLRLDFLSIGSSALPTDPHARPFPISVGEKDQHR